MLMLMLTFFTFILCWSLDWSIFMITRIIWTLIQCNVGRLLIMNGRDCCKTKAIILQFFNLSACNCVIITLFKIWPWHLFEKQTSSKTFIMHSLNLCTGLTNIVKGIRKIGLETLEILAGEIYDIICKIDLSQVPRPTAEAEVRQKLYITRAIYVNPNKRLRRKILNLMQHKSMHCSHCKKNIVNLGQSIGWCAGQYASFAIARNTHTSQMQHRNSTNATYTHHKYHMYNTHTSRKRGKNTWTMPKYNL